MFLRNFLCALACMASGCFLPMATGAPESARTVGRGNFGGSFHAEAPTLNLTAENDDLDDSADDDNVVIAPAGAMAFGIQYGVTKSLDLEVRLDGALYYFVVPIPVGASAGARLAVIDQPGFALSVAGRFGIVGFSTSEEDPDTGEAKDTDRASATYVTGAVTLQVGQGFVRPSLTLSATPAQVNVDLSDEPEKDYRALATTTTAALHMGLGPLTFAPFLALTYFSSNSIDSQGFVSGGVAFYWGHERPPVAAPLPGPRPYPQPY